MNENQLIEWWDNAERVQSPENPREVNMMLLLQAFYKQVAANKREQCAKVADGFVGGDVIADRIRALKD